MAVAGTEGGGSVPGAPVDFVAEVVSVLGRCLSGGGGDGERWLGVAEATRPGFFLALAEAAVGVGAAQGVGEDVRWLAAIHLKNGIGRRWKAPRGAGAGSSAGGVLGVEETAHVRRVLLESVEDVQGRHPTRVMTQVILAVGRAARSEFPAGWPDLVPRLGSAMGMGASRAPWSASRWELRGRLLAWGAMHRVIKELATKRLGSDQRAFRELAAGLFASGIWSEWEAVTEDAVAGVRRWVGGDSRAWPPGAGGPAGDSTGGGEEEGLAVAVHACRASYMGCKVVCRLLVHGFEGDAHSLQSRSELAHALGAWLGLVGSLEAVSGRLEEEGDRAEAGGEGKEEEGEARRVLVDVDGREGRGEQEAVLRAFVRRMVHKAVKCAAAVQARHPHSAAGSAAFAPWLAHCVTRLGTVGARRVASARGALWGDREAVHCCALLSQVLGTAEYAAPAAAGAGGDRSGGPGYEALEPGTAGLEGRRARRDELARDARTALDGFWGSAVPGGSGESYLLRLLRVLMTCFVPLTPAEVREWGEDPEEFYVESEARREDGHSVRCAAEMLVKALMSAHGDVVQGYIVGSALMGSVGRRPVADGAEGLTAELLEREALYSFVATACYDIKEGSDALPQGGAPSSAGGSQSTASSSVLNLESLLVQSILPELSSPARHPAGRVVRRAGVRLAGAWMHVVSSELRMPLYQALVGLMGGFETQGVRGDHDACVTLTCVDTLRTMVDDWDFEPDAFLPFLDPLISALLNFAFPGSAPQLHPQGAEAASSEPLSEDGQLKVFSLITLLVERMGSAIRPHSEAVIRVVPAAWAMAGAGGTESAGDPGGLLRSQIIGCLQGLVSALGAASFDALPYLGEVLAHVTNPEGPDALALYEDGMQLWLICAKHAPGPPLDWASRSGHLLLDLWPALTKALANGWEHLRIVFALVESYALLGGPEFVGVQEYGGLCISLADRCIGEVVDRGMLVSLSAMGVVLQCGASDGSFLVALPQASRLLSRLASCVLARRAESFLVRAAAAAVLSRAAILAPRHVASLLLGISLHDMRLALLSRPAGEDEIPAGPGDPLAGVDPTESLLHAWVDALLASTSVYGRKLACLGLAAILPLMGQAALRCLGPTLDGLVAVVAELGSISPERGGGAPHAQFADEEVYASGGDPIGIQRQGDATDADAESSRRLWLRDVDPVHHLPARGFVLDRLEDLRAQAGDAAFSEALGGVQADTRSALDAMAAKERQKRQGTPSLAR